MNLPISIIRSELRGKKNLFFLASLAMAMAATALTLVLSLNDSFEYSLARSAQTLLGGDASVRLSQRDFNDEELRWLEKNSTRLSRQFSARMLAVAGDKTYLARLRAVDNAYPLFGVLHLNSGRTAAQALSAEIKNGVYPALVAKELLTLLDINIGDQFTLGELNLRVVDVVDKEPDPNFRLWLGAPLVMVPAAALANNELNQFGALLDRYVRVDLGTTEEPAAWRERLLDVFPDAGWSIETANSAAPSLRRLVGNIHNFLTLVSLAAMLLAGIGVGGAVSSFLAARMKRIAVIKTVGGNAKLIRSVYFTLAMLLAISGAIIGVLSGLAILFTIVPVLKQYLPLPISALWSWSAVGTTLLSATLLAAVFILPPVMRFARINPTALFHAGKREDDMPTMNAAERLITAALALAAIISLPLPWREKTLAFGVIIAAVVLIAAARMLAVFAGQLAKTTRPPVSWGLLFLSRNNRQATACALSFGIGLATLAAIVNVQGNFKDRIDDTLRREAPAFYLLGMREQQPPAVRRRLNEISDTARLQTTPFIRGRITHLGTQKSADIEAPENLGWILRGDRGITWSEEGAYIGASKVVKGRLWDDTMPTPQVSFDAEAGDVFGLQIGDTIRLNILGRPYEAHISSFREIEWGNFDINFVMIFSAKPFANVPYSHLGAVFLPPEEHAAAQLALAQDFPNITPISTAVLFDAAKSLLMRLGLILSVATLLLLIGGIPVVIASLTEGHERRLRDSASLGLIGVSSKNIIAAGLVEMSATALVAVLPALVFGMFAGWLIMENIFSLTWQPRLAEMALLGLGSVLVFLIAGFFSLFIIAKQSPFALLRND